MTKAPINPMHIGINEKFRFTRRRGSTEEFYIKNQRVMLRKDYLSERSELCFYKFMNFR